MTIGAVVVIAAVVIVCLLLARFLFGTRRSADVIDTPMDVVDHDVVVDPTDRRI